MVNNDLENKLKQIFKETSNFYNSSNLSIVNKYIKIGCKAYVDEKYSFAKTLFTKGLGRENIEESQKSFLLKMRVNCNIKLFFDKPNEESFKQICGDYEKLLEIREVPEIYGEYIDFLSNGLYESEEFLMNYEALKIAERAASIYPYHLELNATLSKLYYLVGDEKKSYNTMVYVCKLAYDNPQFLYSRFFERIFEPAPNSNDEETIPVKLLMKYDGKAILNENFLLNEYAELILDRANGLEYLAYFFLTRSYDLDPFLGYKLKEDIFEAYNDALLNAKDEKERTDIQIHFNDFSKRHNLNNDPAWKSLWDSHLSEMDEDFDDGYEYIDEDPPQETKALTQHPSPPKNKSLEKKIEVLLPKQIKEKLDKYVVGQESAKKALSVAASNHLLRISGKTKGIEKTNVLLLGPTGCGKTFSARILSKILDLPFVIYDNSKITSAGYVGDDATDCLYMLYEQCKGNLNRTQQGIIFLDEADKIKKTPGTGKDVGGEGAQQQLLKLIEGSDVNVPVSRDKTVAINTDNIMFIVAGAFSDTLNGESLGEKISGPRIGFGVCEEKTIGQTLRRLTDKDLVDYGFLPEFAGRLQKRAVLDELTEVQLKKILIEPKNALIPQYEKQFKAWDIKLDVDNSAISKISEEACKLKAGARSLKTICESIFDDYLFELPGSSTKELKITEKEVLGALEKARS